MFVVVDYQKGNLLSVERGLISAGADAVVSSNPRVIERAEAIVLPGVGAFADAADTMHSLGQMDVVYNRIMAGVPFLGICLGMHLMFTEGVEGASSERNPQGLGVLPGVVDRIPKCDNQGRTYKVPHVGWNSIIPPVNKVGKSDADLQDFGASAFFSSSLFDGINPGEFFYFTHSFAAPNTDAAIALTQHSVLFPCAVQYGDVAFGVQFHPEKSSDAGAALLRNFVRIAKER